ncbi:MAG: hypothetical protein O2856_13585, partial [Planctomycetota bacterium]|nr:hypothetical protein [Planctomycetota bacterium]
RSSPMRNVIYRFCKSSSHFFQVKFGLKCLAAIPIALGIAIGISSWQEFTADYWRDFNTVRVEHLRTQKGIAVGKLAPPFLLRGKTGKQAVTLESLGKKPVVLIFGSSL